MRVRFDSVCCLRAVFFCFCFGLLDVVCFWCCLLFVFGVYPPRPEPWCQTTLISSPRLHPAASLSCCFACQKKTAMLTSTLVSRHSARVGTAAATAASAQLASTRRMKHYKVLTVGGGAGGLAVSSTMSRKLGKGAVSVEQLVFLQTSNNRSQHPIKTARTHTIITTTTT